MLVAGCGGYDVAGSVAARSKTNLQKTSNIYALYISRNSYNGPKKIEELKSFLQTDPSIEKNIGYMGIGREDFDKISVSERDGEPFKFRFGLRFPVMSSAQPIVFETTGVDGKRQVMMSDLEIREVDSAEYDLMLSGKYKPSNKTVAPDVKGKGAGG